MYLNKYIQIHALTFKNIGQNGKESNGNNYYWREQFGKKKVLIETKQEMDEGERSETLKICIFSLSTYSYSKKLKSQQTKG